MARRNESGDTGRRGFLHVIGLGTAAVSASSLITACASGGLGARTRDATTLVSGSRLGSPPRTIRSWMASAGHLSAESGSEPGHIFE